VLSVVPEVGVQVFCVIHPGVSVHAGYDCLCWSGVTRAGDQIDRVIDTRQSPTSPNLTGGGGVRPIVPFRETTFWAHGVNVGVRVEY
jgi:hypothetical protein